METAPTRHTAVEWHNTIRAPVRADAYPGSEKWSPCTSVGMALLGHALPAQASPPYELPGKDSLAETPQTRTTPGPERRTAECPVRRCHARCNRGTWKYDQCHLPCKRAKGHAGAHGCLRHEDPWTIADDRAQSTTTSGEGQHPLEGSAHCLTGKAPPWGTSLFRYCRCPYRFCVQNEPKMWNMRKIGHEDVHRDGSDNKMEIDTWKDGCLARHNVATGNTQEKTLKHEDASTCVHLRDGE